MPKHIIIVGNGMVSYKFCERFINKLEKLSKLESYRVTVFGEEGLPAYDRVHLSEYFDTKNKRDLVLASEQWYKDNKINLYLGDKVVEINREEKSIISEKGVRLSYDKLILATGSDAFIPSIQGVEKEGIFVYRTLDDLDKICAYSSGVSSCAVIGGGLLGLEAAKASCDLGLKTTVVEFANRLMPRQLDNCGGAVLKDLIQEKQIDVLLSCQTRQFVGEGRVEKIIFANEEELEIDMVVISAGIRPRDELAKLCGLEVGECGGIVVDNKLQTSDKNIYAIGECALYEKKIYGLVAPGYQMATVVCNNILGEEEVFAGADMSTKLKLIGIDVCNFGKIEVSSKLENEIIINDRGAKVYKKLVIDGEKKVLLGGILVGDGTQYDKLLQLYQNEVVLSEPYINLLVSSSSNVDNEIELSDDAQICSCENVTKKQLCQAISQGHKDFDSLKKTTKAGTGCGGCVSLVKSILKKELSKLGEEVQNNLCEHFSFTRVQLYDLIKVAKIKDFGTLISKYGKGMGCEVCKPAVASIFASLWNEQVLKQPQILDTNDAYLANLQKNGTYSIVPRVAGGEITPDQLIVLGKVAKEFELYTKITGGQRIDLFGARVEQLPIIWERLIEAGFETGQAYGKSLRTIKSCVGSTWCRYGVADSTSLAIKLENRYKGIRTPHKIKSAVSGCTRECAEAQSKDFGVIATEKGWNLYVCGNGGMKPRHADLFAVDLDEQTLIKYIDRFLIYYINTADQLTRTSVWLENLSGGLKHLQEVIIEDSLGICEELEKQMDYLVKTYHCEWKATINDPNKLLRFKPFVNSLDQDETVKFVKKRGQFNPA